MKKLNYATGSIDQMLDQFYARIDELDNSEIAESLSVDDPQDPVLASDRSNLQHNISNVVKELEAACLEYFHDTSLDHEFSKYLEDYYCYVDAKILPGWYDDGSDAVEFQVRAELDYDSFLDLTEGLDYVIAKYNDGVYFDMYTTTVAVCNIPADDLNDVKNR